MMQIVEQTDEQKFAMYDKLSKEELIHMLISANKHLDNRTPVIINNPSYPSHVIPCNPYPLYPYSYPVITTTGTGPQG